MKQILFTIQFAALSAMLMAQTATFSTNQDSDPEATAILDNLRTTFDGYETARYDFDIDIEIPGSAVETMEGDLVQKGEKFVFSFGEQIIYSDNASVWVHDPSINTVQIYDADFGDDGSFISPTEMLNIYRSDDYTYAIVNEYYEGKTVVKELDFKPLDADSEFFKIRLELTGKNNDIKTIKVFAKDGSRYILRIKSIVPNESIEDEYFTFDATKYDDIQIENLRID